MEVDMVRRIVNVIPKVGFLLKVLLDNGSYIRWDDKIEISVNEVYQLAQK